MRSKFIIVTLATLLISAGCAVQNDKTGFKGLGLTFSTNIQELENGDYVAAVEAAPLAGRKSGAEGYALVNATKFCDEKNQSVKVLKKDLSSHFQNGVARITFKCIG